MQKEIQPFYSHSLQREMPVHIYGHAGKPILYIPCQDGRAGDFEAFGMSDTLAPWIESGECVVWSVDTVDAESWSDRWGDPYHRIRRHEAWVMYLARELAPFILSRSGADGGLGSGRPTQGAGIMTFGCSLGGGHALNLYLRFPDLFDRCLALSGMYHASYFFGDYMDELDGLHDQLPGGTPLHRGVQPPQGRGLHRPGRLGGALEPPGHGSTLPGAGHPRLGGLLGLGRQPRLALVA